MKLGTKELVGLIVALLVVASLITVALPKSEFQVSNLTVKPREVLVGSPVTISADVRNIGKASGEYQATLMINGNVQETKTLKVPAGSTESISFTFTPTSLGEYKVALDTLTTAFVAKEGILPLLYQGDKWQYQVSSSQGNSEVTYEVQGEATIKGKVVYVVHSTGKVPNGYDRSVSYIDKGTLYADYQEKSGTVEDVPVTEKVIVTSRQIEEGGFPLEVGKEWSVSWGENVTIKKGLVPSTEARQFSRSFKVEGIENVTTAAGNFRCFRVVERDEVGSIVGTYWYSDSVKREVKYELKGEGQYVTYELISYDISTTPPATPPPKLSMPTEYKEPIFGYSISYPKGWEIATEEGEEGSVQVFTSSGGRGLRFAWLRIRVISLTGEADLTVLYEQIMASTQKEDPNFEIVDSDRVPAELPYYEVEWNSAVKDKDVKIRGKTILALKGERLFMVSGWVQQAFADEYWAEFEKVTSSFGIAP